MQTQRENVRKCKGVAHKTQESSARWRERRWAAGGAGHPGRLWGALPESRRRDPVLMVPQVFILPVSLLISSPNGLLVNENIKTASSRTRKGGFLTMSRRI